MDALICLYSTVFNEENWVKLFEKFAYLDQLFPFEQHFKKLFIKTILPLLVLVFCVLYGSLSGYLYNQDYGWKLIQFELNHFYCLYELLIMVCLIDAIEKRFNLLNTTMCNINLKNEPLLAILKINKLSPTFKKCHNLLMILIKYLA